MDGKLIGRLSPSPTLTGRLSFVSGAKPALTMKTVTRNGMYHASDDEVDGYYIVIADVPAEPIIPRAFDLTGGYVSNGTWTPGGDTVMQYVWQPFSHHVLGGGHRRHSNRESGRENGEQRQQPAALRQCDL